MKRRMRFEKEKEGRDDGKVTNENHGGKLRKIKGS